MRRAAAWVIAMLLTLSLTACAGKPAEIVVSAAASLRDVLTEIQPQFESRQPPVKLRFNFGSSGALAQQIAQGAPADLFISAAPEPMQALVDKHLVEKAEVRTIATNTIVLIRPKGGTVTGWADLPGAGRIAMGDTAHVPAGQYGQAVLQKLNLWDAVQPRLVLGEDVRQVLHYVEAGEAAAGIVYRTDAATSANVEVVAEAPAGSHPPVVYPMAVLTGAKDGARAFADYLLSPDGRRAFTKYGFGGAE